MRSAGARAIVWSSGIGIATIAVILIWNPGIGAVPPRDMSPMPAGSVPRDPAWQLRGRDPEEGFHPDTGFPHASGDRQLVPSTLAQLQGATSIGELQRLFASANPPADAKQRAIREISFLREQLQEDAERLRAHLAEPDPDDPAPWLTEMKLQVKVLGTERSLNGLIRGDYCFGTYRRLDHPLFEVLSWPGGAPPEHALLLILDRDRPALYAQLTREIDRYEKVTAFNKLNEEMRRRVLFLRETSLREDPPEERRWLSTYFPEEFGIDELTAMIH